MVKRLSTVKDSLCKLLQQKFLSIIQIKMGAINNKKKIKNKKYKKNKNPSKQNSKRNRNL